MAGRLPLSLTIVLALGCGTAVYGQSPRQAKLQRQVHAKQPDPAPVAAVPLSPEQLPATPPQVAFSSGILTIVANNSTLGDILRAVHHQTGASVDVPGNATERVVGQFGPGPARDVLATLLNGSHFNYVLLGSQTNPSSLDRVMLISKSVGNEQPTQQASTSSPQTQMAVPQAADSENSNDDAQEMPDTAESPDDQTTQPPADDQQPAQQNPLGQSNGGVKTPEQLLQELQQRQQQMQQQQQQQPGFPPTPLSPAPPPH
jgi:hypothetical protein